MALELGSADTPEKKNDHASGAGKHSGGARFAWADNGQSNGTLVERGLSSHALHGAQTTNKDHRQHDHMCGPSHGEDDWIR
ncbi:Retrovirus-related Pol polyprotein from transposon TNT 1-94 [Sesbania bispinosa]|nr:Retrovirus-related Pol polyprotein from transposon TNT 1-94 [Sesbania bispinosa]